MSSKNVLEVDRVGKVYHIYDDPLSRLKQILLSRLGKKYYREFWAVTDVSLNIEKGKIYGILGKNGAGKSTLLQMVCGILEPSHGSIKTDARISALLELGSGFNPEFTGLENIFLSAQLLGLSKDETDGILQEIIDFADIGSFIDQPVKTYSSGMFARLAFSVAVFVEPDLLIVDEALSVGDAWFQHKSMARMRQLMESGCSVLFVSHSIDAVRALCDEAIWLEQGRVKMQGNVTDVTNAYMNDVFIEHNKIVLQSIKQIVATEKSTKRQIATTQDMPEHDRRNGKAEQPMPGDLVGGAVFSVRSKLLKNKLGQVTDYLQQGERFSLEFEIDIHRKINNLSLGFLIKDQFGQELTGESFFNTFRKSLNFDAGQTARFVFSSTMLLRGGQSYSVALRINQVSQWDRSDNVIIFANELAMVFDVLADRDNPMWFKFRMPFEVDCK
jgi:lipopolysaccharide transport system ATP-binding protein